MSAFREAVEQQLEGIDHLSPGVVENCRSAASRKDYPTRIDSCTRSRHSRGRRVMGVVLRSAEIVTLYMALLRGAGSSILSISMCV